jgi:hypothetical protein
MSCESVSPFTNSISGGSISGGSIKFDDEFFKQIIFVSVIAAIIYLIYYLYYQIFYSKLSYEQVQLRRNYANISGEDFNTDAKQTLYYGEKIKNPEALDHYQMGTVYLINAQNPVKAHSHFTKALNHVINGNVDTRQAPFILERIDDLNEMFINFPEIEDLPLQEAIAANARILNKTIDNVKKEKLSAKKGDTDFTQKLLLSRQAWLSESQNVHDSSIYTELQNQYNIIIKENTEIPNRHLRTYSEAINWLRIRYSNNKEKMSKVEKVISMWNNNYPIGSMQNVKEQELISSIWARIYDPRNKKNFGSLRESFGDSTIDCIENSNAVCMAGRTSKMFQSLAILDCNPEIGVLKTKQLLRNEIYERAAKIVDEHIGSSGSISNELRNAYNKSDNTPQVNELIKCMRDEITEVGNQYKNLLPKYQLDLIISECISSV